MLRKRVNKIVVVVPLLVVLVALDTVRVLEGLPLLVIGLVLALLLTNRLRGWLHGTGRANLAMLPFTAAALALLLAFCRGRNLSQLILLGATLGVVFSVLMAALSGIGEASKRGVRGVVEFLGFAGVGLAIGLALSLVFLLEEVGSLGGTSLAGP